MFSRHPSRVGGAFSTLGLCFLSTDHWQTSRTWSFSISTFTVQGAGVEVVALATQVGRSGAQGSGCPWRRQEASHPGGPTRGCLLQIQDIVRRRQLLTIFREGKDGQQDVDVAILQALLKGEGRAKWDQGRSQNKGAGGTLSSSQSDAPVEGGWLAGVPTADVGYRCLCQPVFLPETGVWSSLSLCDHHSFSQNFRVKRKNLRTPPPNCASLAPRLPPSRPCSRAPTRGVLMNHGALGRLLGLTSAIRLLFLSPHFLFPLFCCWGGQYFPVFCAGCPMEVLGTRPPGGP